MRKSAPGLKGTKGGMRLVCPGNNMEGRVQCFCNLGKELGLCSQGSGGSPEESFFKPEQCTVWFRKFLLAAEGI